MRHLVFIIMSMICMRIFAQDAALVGIWQRQAPQLWQQLELKEDGSYQRSIVTAAGKRTEIGTWRSDVSVLVLSPDHVISTQGARMPLPPQDKQIDVAAVDANSLTIYYDGNATEIWQRLPHVETLPAPAAISVAAAVSVPPLKASLSIEQLPSRKPLAVRLPIPQVALAPAPMPTPSVPEFLIAVNLHPRNAPSTYESVSLPAPAIEQSSPPVFVVAANEPVIEPVSLPAETPLQPPPRVAPTGLYPEAKVVELITQIACEELRYPQRSLVKSEQRYRALAQSLGFEADDPAKLQRTLRYYQSNAEFMHSHQHAIAENSLRCATIPEQVSAMR